MARAARRARGQALGVGLLVAALAATAAACANTGEPPGGPPDEKPPVILSVYPESGAVLPEVRGDAVLQYDDVIDEMGGGGSSGGSGAGGGGLAARILLSPTAGPVKVSWHRSSIHVKPAEGWKRGRVYHLQVLPGIGDLRRNVTKEGRTIVFSTGPDIPHAELEGIAVAWVEQRALSGGLIRAARLPDTVAYLAVADSAGRFRLGNLPSGRYAVFAVVDQNGNRVRDRREAYDSTVVTLDSSATVELWAFTHDTTGPRLRQAESVDSLAARLTFSQPLDPTQPLDSIGVRVLALPDSTPVRVRTLLRPAAYDSLTARERATADSVRAAQDTTPKDTTARRRPPDTTGQRTPRDTTDVTRAPAADTSDLRLVLRRRPVPQDKLVVRLERGLLPGTKYFVEIRGARNLSGARADGHAVLVVPKPKPAPSPATPPPSPRPP